MKILILPLGVYQTNCYIAAEESSGKGVIIDPGDEPERIFEQVEKNNITPEKVLLTHGHVDHIGAVPAVVDKYKIPLYAGREEQSMLRSATENFSAMFGAPIVCPQPERLLSDGDTVTFGDTAFIVLGTPGHSPGGICYLAGSVVFCGDTLFAGSVGRTDFPGCSHEQLIQSIIDKLMVLPDDTICYPGHGEATSIGRERRSNPFLTGGHFV